MASYNRQVIDIQASAGMTGDQSNEHQRRWTQRGWRDAAKHGNYDPTRWDCSTHRHIKEHPQTNKRNLEGAWNR